ncbi:MAG: crossover junction endodeoxyribonuclease RuvC [Sciscionella sp.]
MTNPNCLCGIVTPGPHPDCPMHPPYVLGLDTALRRTGVAAITHRAGACEAQTWVIATPTPRADTVAAHVAAIESVTRQLVDILNRMARQPELALIEAPSYGSIHGSPHERAGVWWSAAAMLGRRGIPVGTCAPMTRAKWATGNGRADKAAVVRAMYQLWPGLGCTQSEARHNEADALALAHACAQRLRWPVPVRRHHGDSLAVIRWPDTEAPR